MPHSHNSRQIRNNEIHNRLIEELERLKKMFGLNPRLKVKWIPSTDSLLSGEVKGTHILIYEIDEEEAIETLRHEVIDFLVSSAIEPYSKIANELIKLINKEAYNRKERVVDLLLQWIKMDKSEEKKQKKWIDNVDMLYNCKI